MLRNRVIRQWWHDAIFYEIYVQSFSDSNGDGVGDLRGVESRLDYLQRLGVDAIWLTPIMESPFNDCGYDCSNYYGINPDFGDFSDFQSLVNSVHDRGMRIILDLVLGYTSEEHPWFQQAKEDIHAATRDFYVWAKGVDGGPPNNWYCNASASSAWHYNPPTDDYFYHAFLPSQPHLNWTSPAVEEEMVKVFRFWLDQGVDGFRLDAINYLYADQELRNNPLEGISQVHVSDRNHRNIHRILKRLRGIADSYGEIMMVGEVFPGDTMESKEYHGVNHDELQLTFNFSFSTLPENTRWYDGESKASGINFGNSGEWERSFSVPEFRRLLENYDTVYSALDLWPTVVMGNHDQPRIHSIYREFVSENNADEMAKLIATYELTAKGTPFLYYGEEIGMENMRFSSVDQLKDLFGVAYYEFLVKEEGLPSQKALIKAQRVARDKCRTPMQWSNRPQAGFSPNEITWQLVNPNYPTRNVETQLEDRNSILNHYMRLIALRKSHPALYEGDYVWDVPVDENCLVYKRAAENETVLVLLNFSESETTIELSGNCTVLYSTQRSEGEKISGDITVKGVESLVVEESY